MAYLGVDLGNYATKTNKGISFISKATHKKGIENNISIKSEGKVIYLGEGEFDTEYRKAYKKNLMYLLQGALELSTKDNHNKIVTGLPISQFKEDKEYLINRIMQSGLVDDVEVVPEGVVVVPRNYEGIVIDIGGRTTDICLIIREGNKRRLLNPTSLPIGVMNLETDFINNLNSSYGLDLKQIDAQRIIKNGLYIYGEKQIVNMDIFKNFVEGIIGRLQVDYSIKTNNVVLIGGGSELLYQHLKARIPQAYLVKSSFMANANAYGNIAREVF